MLFLHVLLVPGHRGDLAADSAAGWAGGEAGGAAGAGEGEAGRHAGPPPPVPRVPPPPDPGPLPRQQQPGAAAPTNIRHHDPPGGDMTSRDVTVVNCHEPRLFWSPRTSRWRSMISTTGSGTNPHTSKATPPLGR